MFFHTQKIIQNNAAIHFGLLSISRIYIEEELLSLLRTIIVNKTFFLPLLSIFVLNVHYYLNFKFTYISF